MDRTELIKAIEAHSALTGLAPATITRCEVENSRLYDRLIGGGDVTTTIARKVMDWITEDRSSRRAS